MAAEDDASVSVLLVAELSMEITAPEKSVLLPVLLDLRSRTAEEAEAIICLFSTEKPSFSSLLGVMTSPPRVFDKDLFGVRKSFLRKPRPGVALLCGSFEVVAGIVISTDCLRIGVIDDLFLFKVLLRLSL